MHSPEPWRGATDPGGVSFVLSGDGQNVIACEVMFDDAYRIAACVNALARVPTAALEALCRNEQLREQTAALVRHNAQAALEEEENDRDA